MSISFPIARQVPFGRIRIRSAQGAVLTTDNDRKLIDFNSGFGAAALGYGHPRLTDAVLRQMQHLSHAIPSLLPYVDDTAATADVVACIEQQDWIGVTTTSGSEAIEVALKIAYLTTQRPGTMVIDGAYHGQSIGTLAVSGQKAFVEPLKAMVSNHAYVVDYHSENQCPDSQHDNAVLGHIRDLISHNVNKIGAFLIEPMQNLAGYRSFTPYFAHELSLICRRAGILLICDEIFTGFGRCGRWSISQHKGFSPDLITFGKALTGGIPGGICVGSKDLVAGLFPHNSAPLHAPTFFYSPIVCAAMRESIDVIREERLLERSAAIGEVLSVALHQIQTKTDLIREIRGEGAAQAVVLHSGTGSEHLAVDLCGELLELGVFALNSGFPKGDVLIFCPPLTLSDDELESGISKIATAFSNMENKVRI